LKYKLRQEFFPDLGSNDLISPTNTQSTFVDMSLDFDVSRIWHQLVCRKGKRPLTERCSSLFAHKMFTVILSLRWCLNEETGNRDNSCLLWFVKNSG